MVGGRRDSRREPKWCEQDPELKPSASPQASTRTALPHQRRSEEGAPAAELAVGIRSGLVRRTGGADSRLDLFAGAGLVDGSEPDAEWDELEQKLGNFTALFRDS
ncbi:MAG: hypothetical protein BRD30_13175 [Bacteroidetes bacterium QH_2_63_10]|nr:MAG: hypothetical protein BRD30_13175 [Bacteroidetes bacterium QH_2_63_10]